MNPAMLMVAALALFALPSALGQLTCHHCMGNIATQQLCSQMSAAFTNQTCMGDDAKCATTEIKSNISEVKAYVLGCVNEPHNCTSYKESLCNNVTTIASAANLTIELCNTECCNTSFCNANFLPTMAPTDTTAGTGTTMETTTAAARMFCPELIGMLSIVLMAVFFGFQ